MKTILYIEEKQYVRDNFVKMIKGVGFFNVLEAATVLQAVVLAQRVSIDIIIVGRQIAPEEIDMLDYYLRNRQDTRLIMMAERKSKIANLLKAFEYKIQFEMPTDINLLLETLLAELESNCGGQLRGISLPSFLQMIELEGKTCAIKAMANGQIGCLYCRKGELIEAELGEMTGKKAAIAILDMENTLIFLDYDTPEKKRSITEPLMSILLESGRTKDEKPTGPRENRRYRRFDCLLPVTFFHDENAYPGMITNISLGGIFLKSEKLFEAGRRIEVALYSPSLDKGCKMAGRVVRREEEGMGIEFQPESIKQTGILRTIIAEAQTAPDPATWRADAPASPDHLRLRM